MATGTIKKTYTAAEVNVLLNDMVSLRFPTNPINDLNGPPSMLPSLVLTNGNTLNTPYKAGLTNYTIGCALSFFGSANFSIQFYFNAGDAETIFIRSKSSGSWGSWLKLNPTAT